MATRSHKRELVATASLDWRKALLDRGGARSIALKAAGPDGVDGEVATLDVALDVVAVGGALDLPFQPDDVEDAMRKARSEHAEAARAFYLYAKQWWDGFAKGAGRDLQQREVKLFARDEAGEMRCVCSYVHPLRANRVLDGPHQAARFVSLLPLEKAGSVAGGNADTWHTPLATCARGSGDVWDHADAALLAAARATGSTRASAWGACPTAAAARSRTSGSRRSCGRPSTRRAGARLRGRPGRARRAGGARSRRSTPRRASAT